MSHYTMLVLENGSVYYGWSLYKSVTVVGEIVFNTGMVGYQEIITDPSYSEQVVVFTHPEVGNTGINFEDIESCKPYVKGIVIKNLCLTEHHWRKKQSIVSYLRSKRIPHIYGLDTRMLTKHLRHMGTLMGCISSLVFDMQVLMLYFKSIIKIDTRNLVKTVSTAQVYDWVYSDHYIDSMRNYTFIKHVNALYQKQLMVIVVDFGVKYNILRILSRYVAKVIIVPANTSYNTILRYQPDGILLSNGPGNPFYIVDIANTISKLLPYRIPILGICMGHQVLALALKLNTFKLKFGHHGLNHPVGFLQKVSITSQNHGFAVQAKQADNIINWQMNYNDNTLAAIVHGLYPCLSVQYHPEANPGPNDTENVFLHFVQVIQTTKQYPFNRLC